PAPLLSTLSLHDALPICLRDEARSSAAFRAARISLTGAFRRGCLISAQARFNSQSASLVVPVLRIRPHIELRSPLDVRKQMTCQDRKSTRLNSSHLVISY